MKSYVLWLSGNGEIFEFCSYNDDEAIRESIILLKNRAFTNELWGPYGNNDDGLPCKKLYFFDTPEKAYDDDLEFNDPIAILSTLGYVSPYGF